MNNNEQGKFQILCKILNILKCDGGGSWCTVTAKETKFNFLLSVGNVRRTSNFNINVT